jgi:hypothetical protein
MLLAEAGYPNGFKTTLWFLNADVRPKGDSRPVLPERGGNRGRKLRIEPDGQAPERMDGLIYLGLGARSPTTVEADPPVQL